MGVRTTDKSGVQRAGQRDIGTKLRAAFQKPLVFQPRKPRADAELGQYQPPSWADQDCVTGSAASHEARKAKKPLGHDGHLDFVSNLV